MRRPVRVWLPWAAMAVVVAVCLGIGAAGDTGPRTPAERVEAISRELRCPSCAGESVAESQAPTARAIRADVAQRVGQGQSDDEVIAAVVARFGDQVRQTPPADGAGGLVWMVPVVGVVCAGAALVFALRRWSRRGPARPATPQDVSLVEAALAREDW